MVKQILSTSSNTATIFSSFLHALILFIILSALFVFVISKIEEKLFNDEISKHIQEELPKSLKENDTDGSIKLLLKGVPFNRLEKLYSEPSEDTQIYNTWLKKVMLLVASAILIIIIISALFLYFSCGQLIPVGHIVGENIVIFTLVGIFEGLFFYYIASKYVPVPPSLLINRLYGDLKSW